MDEKATKAIKAAAVKTLQQGLESLVAVHCEANPLAQKAVAVLANFMSGQAVAFASVGAAVAAEKAVQKFGGEAAVVAAADPEAVAPSPEALMLADLFKKVAIEASEELSAGLQSGRGFNEAVSSALVAASDKANAGLSSAAQQLGAMALNVVTPDAVALISANLGNEAGALAQSSSDAGLMALSSINRGDSASAAFAVAGRAITVNAAFAALRPAMQQGFAKQVITQQTADNLLTAMGDSAAAAVNAEMSIPDILQNIVRGGGIEAINSLIKAGLLGAEVGNGLIAELKVHEPKPVIVETQDPVASDHSLPMLEAAPSDHVLMAGDSELDPLAFGG